MKTPALLWPLTLALALGSCGPTEPKDGNEKARLERERSLAKRLKSACSSPATYDRLKQVAFDEAIQIRNADPVNLDLLSTYSLVRVENPVVQSRDETLDVTVCSGRFILQVPPGAERAFDGKRQLTAEIEYAAQAAADGSGLVYQIKGAEPIIYRLATFDLRSEAYRPSTPVEKVAAGRAAEPPIARRANPPQAMPRPNPIATTPPSPERSELSVNDSKRQVRASSPSFNCRAARSRSEKMVCGNDRLALLDRQMSSQFYSSLSRGDIQVRNALRRTRDRFLSSRERCSDQQCVEQAYLARMDEIRNIADR